MGYCTACFRRAYRQQARHQRAPAPRAPCSGRHSSRTQCSVVRWSSTSRRSTCPVMALSPQPCPERAGESSQPKKLEKGTEKYAPPAVVAPETPVPPHPDQGTESTPTSRAPARKIRPRERVSAQSASGVHENGTVHGTASNKKLPDLGTVGEPSVGHACLHRHGL